MFQTTNQIYIEYTLKPEQWLPCIDSLWLVGAVNECQCGQMDRPWQNTLPGVPSMFFPCGYSVTLPSLSMMIQPLPLTQLVLGHLLKTRSNHFRRRKANSSCLTSWEHMPWRPHGPSASQTWSHKSTSNQWTQNGFQLIDSICFIFINATSLQHL